MECQGGLRTIQVKRVVSAIADAKQVVAVVTSPENHSDDSLFSQFIEFDVHGSSELKFYPIGQSFEYRQGILGKVLFDHFA